MPRVTCAFCGVPFFVRKITEGAQDFCCSGCALASRIPMNGDVLPVSRGLVIALALGFGLFNEILFSVLGAALIAQGRVDVGPNLLGIGIAVGAALFAVSFGFFVTARSRHWTDLLAGAIAVGFVAWTIVEGMHDGVTAAGWPLLGANAWLAVWWSRGWLRRAIGRRGVRRE